MFHQSVIVLFFAELCWGGSVKERLEACIEARWDKLIRQAGSVVSMHTTIMEQRSMFSARLLPQSCSIVKPRRYFVPRAIRLFEAVVAQQLSLWVTDQKVRRSCHSTTNIFTVGSLSKTLDPLCFTGTVS